MTVKVESLLTATYTSTAEGETLLKKLTRSAGFSSENVFARLAVARSLKDPPIKWPAELDEDLSGKQIRGQTLLGRQEIAIPLIAMVCEVHRAERPSLDELRRLIRLHWDRGLRLLTADQAGGSVDELFLTYATEALSDESAQSRGSVSPSSVLQELVVGQQRLKKGLAPLLATASASTPPRLGHLVGLAGPSGYGKRHIARAIATSLQLPFIEVSSAEVKSGFVAAVRSRLSDQGYLIPRVGNSAELPACLMYVSDGEFLRLDDHRTLQALASKSRAVRVSGELVRLKGGAIVLAGQVLPPEKKRVDVVLEAYARDEVAEIIRRGVGSWPLEVRRHLSLAGRLVPRDALVLANEFRDAIKSRGYNARPSETLLLTLMREKWGLDRLGLAEADYATLARIANNKVNRKDLSLRDVFFFSRLGLVRESDQRVVLTARGVEALHAWEGAP